MFNYSGSKLATKLYVNFLREIAVANKCVSTQFVKKPTILFIMKIPQNLSYQCREAGFQLFQFPYFSVFVAFFVV